MRLSTTPLGGSGSHDQAHKHTWSILLMSSAACCSCTEMVRLTFKPLPDAPCRPGGEGHSREGLLRHITKLEHKL